MSRLPWKSLSLCLDLDRQIDSAFDELIHKPWGAFQGEAGCWPAMDVYETADEYLVVADVPGILPEELQVMVADDELVVRGRRDVQTHTQLGQTVRIEREHGEFCRRVRLDHAVDQSHVESRFEQGQLIVRLTKQKPAKPATHHE